MNTDDQWGKELHDGLHSHLRGLESTMSMTQVQDKARKVRRNRTLAVSAAAVAVVAMIVPAALFSRGHDSGAPMPATQSTGNATTASSPTTGPSSPTSAPAGGETLLADAPTGAAPMVAYLSGEGRTLVRPDGSQVTLPKPATSLARAGDRYLVLAPYGNEGLHRVYVVAADGTVTKTPYDSAWAISNGTNAAFVTTSGEVIAYWDTGDVSLGTPEKGADIVAKGIIGNGSCKEADGGSCIVFYQGNNKDQVGMTDSHGIVDHPVPGALSLGGVVRTESGWLLATQTSYSDTGSCWQVTDQDGKQLWKTCDYALNGFSTDGSLIMADPAYRDGIGPNKYFILDGHTGRELAAYRVEQGYFSGTPIWEDAIHVLVVTSRWPSNPQHWTGYRLAPGEAPQTVLQPTTTGSDMSPGWTF